MLQNLGLINALIGKKNFLILDEPFNGLDPVQKKRVMSYFNRINKDDNVTILITSHNLADVEKFSDQIALIKNGKIVSNESKKNIIAKYQSIENYYFTYFDENH